MVGVVDLLADNGDCREIDLCARRLGYLDHLLAKYLGVVPVHNVATQEGKQRFNAIKTKLGVALLAHAIQAQDLFCTSVLYRHVNHFELNQGDSLC
jgi:hypothetical protein